MRKAICSMTLQTFHIEVVDFFFFFQYLYIVFLICPNLGTCYDIRQPSIIQNNIK